MTSRRRGDRTSTPRSWPRASAAGATTTAAWARSGGIKKERISVDDPTIADRDQHPVAARTSWLEAPPVFVSPRFRCHWTPRTHRCGAHGPGMFGSESLARSIRERRGEPDRGGPPKACLARPGPPHRPEHRPLEALGPSILVRMVPVPVRTTGALPSSRRMAATQCTHGVKTSGSVTASGVRRRLSTLGELTPPPVARTPPPGGPAVPNR